MSLKNITIGEDSFRRIRERGYCYIDKTGFIEEFLVSPFDKVTLLTRPMRFGKSLLLDTVDEFFNINKESSKIFSDLTIATNKEICSTWMNKFPTLTLTFNSFSDQTFQDFIENFAFAAKRSLDPHFENIVNTKNEFIDKDYFNRLFRRKLSLNELKNYLSTTTCELAKIYNQNVIVLIDEYDVPLFNAWKYNYYDEMLNFIRNLFGTAFKSNKSLEFAILTGCLRISKESIFTGVNNFNTYDIDKERYADKFGFTNYEIDKLLQENKLEKIKPKIKEWYDGYIFGINQEIYCPWDILMYLADIQGNNSFEPKLYWINTSENAIITELINKYASILHQEIEELISGKNIYAKINDNITYRYIDTIEENFWSMLYFSGYLTKTTAALQSEKSSTSLTEAEPNAHKKLTKLTIPNKEIKEIFMQAADQWFCHFAAKSDRTAFFKALWTGDSETCASQLTQFLRQSISYFNSHFAFVHGFLCGIFFKSPYRVISDHEFGEGRPDLVVFDEEQNQACIIEVKYTADAKRLKQLPIAALTQIKTRDYVRGGDCANYSKVIAWGLGFARKECQASCLWLKKAL